MKKRKVTVKLLDDASEEYQELNRMAKEEKINGVVNSPHQTLLKGINENKYDKIFRYKRK